MIEREFIEQGFKKAQIEEYLKKELGKAGFSKADILKTPMVTRIVLHVSRPGLAIGKGGKNIERITEEVAKKFGIENPQIEIMEIPNPALDAQTMADKIATLIERGYSWKSVAYRTVQDIIEAGAQGVELILKGKLAGKSGRKRKYRLAYGYMKKVGDQTKLVDYAKSTAYPKVGAIGIKLRIIRPEVVFPDKVNIAEIAKEKLEAMEKTAEEKKEKAEEEKKSKEGKTKESKGEKKTEEKKEQKTKKEKKTTKDKKSKKEKEDKK
ncbi:MAG: 30S ribosomal protein S3 [Candidatus Diapherotrites archaeon]|nr:30S ribosomal protein S3 [Candidatus Diapherotrites archaeon]